MFLTEVFRGRYVPIPEVTEFPNISRLNELMIVGPITVRSACSHHLCPVMGKVWIGMLPNEHSNLIGLSKYSRICEWIMGRPQIQEEAVTMLADELQDRVKPDGLAIVMEADHFCMQWRGVKDNESKMTNSVMRGAFLKDASLRREFLVAADRQDTERAMARPNVHALESANACAPDVCQPRHRYDQPRRTGRDPEEGQGQTIRPIGITGVLCLSGGIFLQVLEGGRAAVSALYNRIAADPRHRDVCLLSFAEIGERHFAGWAMGQVNLGRLNPAQLIKYSETAVLDPFVLPGAASMALLHELVASAAIIGQS